MEESFTFYFFNTLVSDETEAWIRSVVTSSSFNDTLSIQFSPRDFSTLEQGHRVIIFKNFFIT